MIKIISTIILSAGCIILGILFYNSSKSNKELNNKVTALTKRINQLEQAQESLSEENKQLQQSLNVQKYQTITDQLQLQPQRNNGYYSSPPVYSSSVMETQIDGEFEGWEGETIFKMMNGTIWQQAEYSYTYHYAYMPEVIIYRKSGGYYMKVEDVDDEIRVEQIK